MPVADPAIDHARYAAQLTSAVREAGELALGKFRAPLKSWTKGNYSPVCEADIAVNEFLQERLRDPAGQIGWLSEETEDDPERLRARQCPGRVHGPIGFFRSSRRAQDNRPDGNVMGKPARGTGQGELVVGSDSSNAKAQRMD